MMSSERATYTFFTVLGDVGGFNGAIVIFPAYIMSYYSQQMYNKSVAAETPIRRPARRNKQKKSYAVPEQVLDGQKSVTQPELTGIYDQVKLITRQKVPYWKSLCYFASLCGQDREMRLMKKVTERFEEQLDIRSFVRVRTNLALLIRVLLSDQQMLLFRHQRRRSISIAMKDEKSSSSMDESSDELGKVESKSKHYKMFQKLLGFQVKSKLDRMLIDGIFGSNMNKKINDGDAFGQVRRRQLQQ